MDGFGCCVWSNNRHRARLAVATIPKRVAAIKRLQLKWSLSLIVYMKTRNVSSSITTIFWDHDGVLVDTEPLFYEATRLVLEDHGFELTEEYWVDCQAKGYLLEKVVPKALASSLDFVAVRSKRDDIYSHFIVTRDVVVDGALEVLEQMGASYRMALVTNSHRRFLDQLHAKNSLLSNFEQIVSGDLCDKGKPDPEPYLRAMKLMNVESSSAVAVEDSFHGVTAALTAGLKCIVVRNDFMSGAGIEGVETIVDSIRDLPKTLGSGSP